MAKITILEQDLTTAGSSNVTDNVVYVPGYATMGPINEPTLCSTLSQFQKLFGSVPYKFKSDENNSVDLVSYKEGDYERSYWYAAELLKNGLTVLFERIGDSKILKYAENTLYLNKVQVSGATTEETVTNLKIDVTKEGDKYSYTFKELYKPASTDITFSGIEATEIQLEGLKLTFKCETELEEVGAVISYTLAKPINIIVSGKYNEAKKKIGWVIEENNGYSDQGQAQNREEHSDIDVTYENSIISFVSPLGKEINVRGQAVETNEKYTKNFIKVVAKYPGEYALGINYSIGNKVQDNDSNDILYRLNVSLTNGNSETSENFTIALNELNTKYYKKINSDLVTFEGNIDKELVELDTASVQLYSFDDTVNNLTIVETESKDEFTLKSFYEKLKGDLEEDSIFEKLTDRDEFNIKFITSGSYPTILSSESQGYDGIAKTILRVAADRGDAVALIDHVDEETLLAFRRVKEALSEKLVSSKTGEDAKKYGSIFTPWAKYQLTVANEISQFPGSFAYLKCLATSTKTNANWNAISGVIRGQIPNILTLNQKVTGAISEELQERTGISINPITNINPYGYCIWGNRTLYNNIDDLTASSFLNIRVLTRDVKKVVYQAAKRLTFELVNDVLWVNFKSLIEPTLDQMVSGNGLTNYKLIRVATTKKATLACKIRLYAVEAVEDWDITVELADGYTSVE